MDPTLLDEEGQSELAAATASDDKAAQTKRNKNIKWSITASLVSKLIGFVVMFAAIPLASRMLGDLYGVFMAVGALFNVLSTANFGVGPGITLALSAYATRPDHREERSWFAAVVALVVGSAVALLILAALAYFFLPLPLMFGEKFVPFSDQVYKGFIVLVVLALGLNIVGASDSSYIGYLEDYKFKLYTLAGFVLSVFAIVGAAYFWPTVVGLLLAVHASPLIPRLFAAYRLVIVERPYLQFRLTDIRADRVKALFRSNLAHTTLQLGELGMNLGGMLLVGHFFGTEGTGKLGTLVMWLAMAISLRQMIVNPVWPGISNAWATGDYGWIRSALIKAGGVLAAMGVVVCLGFITVGPWLVERLFDAKFQASPAAMTALGVASLIAFLESLMYHFYIAIDRIWTGAFLSLVRGLVGLGLAILWVPKLEVEGFFWAMSVGTLVSLILMVAMAQKELRTIATARPQQA